MGKSLGVLAGLKRLVRQNKRTDLAQSEARDTESAALKKMREANEALDYSDYLRETGGADTDAAYAEAMREAERDHLEGQVGYGRSGEAMRRAGLRDSGYAAYLAEENDRRRTEARQDADSVLRAARLEQESGYAAYLAAYKKQQESRMSTAIRTLLSENFESADDAYKYALSIGLSDERAQTVRDMSAAYGSDGYRGASLSARITMLNYISRSRMSYEEAYRYALALGAPEETAEEIARYAEESSSALIDFANGVE